MRRLEAHRPCCLTKHPGLPKEFRARLRTVSSEERNCERFIISKGHSPGEEPGNRAKSRPIPPNRSRTETSSEISTEGFR